MVKIYTLFVPKSKRPLYIKKESGKTISTYIPDFLGLKTPASKKKVIKLKDVETKRYKGGIFDVQLGSKAYTRVKSVKLKKRKTIFNWL